MILQYRFSYALFFLQQMKLWKTVPALFSIQQGKTPYCLSSEYPWGFTDQPQEIGLNDGST